MRKIIIAVWATALLGCTIDNGTSPGAPVTIVWSPCINDINAPSWMAVKDGDGAWTHILQTNGNYTFTVRSGRVGMATYANGLLMINYITTDEANASKTSCAGVLRNITGTITGYATLDDIDITGGVAEALVSGTTTAPASFTLIDVTPAAFDVMAIKSRLNVAGGVSARVPSTVLIRRGVTTSPLAALDFAGTEAGPPQGKTLTINNAASNEALSVISSYNTASTAINMSTYATTLGAVSGPVTATFYGLPSTRVSAGEVQTIDVLSSLASNSTTTDTRTAAVTFTDVADKSVTLGPVLGAVSVGTSARPTASYTIQTGYDQTFEVFYSQGTGVATKYIDVAMTRGYAGASATSVSLAVPDLSGLNGFQTTWLLSVGATAHYDFSAAGATYSIFRMNNQSYTAAARSSTFIP